MPDESIKNAAAAVSQFYDELSKEEFNGALLDRVVAETAATIVSYVLYHYTTTAH